MVLVCGINHRHGCDRLSRIRKSNRLSRICQGPDDIRTSVEFEGTSARGAGDVGSTVRARIGGSVPSQKRANRSAAEGGDCDPAPRSQEAAHLQRQRTAVHLFAGRCVPQNRCGSGLEHLHLPWQKCLEPSKKSGQTLALHWFLSSRASALRAGYLSRLRNLRRARASPRACSMRAAWR